MNAQNDDIASRNVGEREREMRRFRIRRCVGFLREAVPGQHAVGQWLRRKGKIWHINRRRGDGVR